MEKLLNLAIEAALRAGEAILKIYNDPTSHLDIERKADDSPLTQADKEAHKTIVNLLENTSYPVLSEEGMHTDYEKRQQWKTFWIVDPLDGTKEFIKRNGEFTVNIALISEGSPVLGVIYVPVKKELYYGSLENGAYKALAVEPLRVSAIAEVRSRALRLPLVKGNYPYTIVASRSHLTPETQQFIEHLKAEYKQVKLTSIGSSLKICLVAEGTANIYPRFAPTMEWDTAAGHAIALAAGKNIYQTDEKTPLQYNKEDLHNPWFIVK